NLWAVDETPRGMNPRASLRPGLAERRTCPLPSARAVRRRHDAGSKPSGEMGLAPRADRVLPADLVDPRAPRVRGAPRARAPGGALAPRGSRTDGTARARRRAGPRAPLRR